MRQVLNETMSFVDLWRTSDPERKMRARHVKPKSLGVRSMDSNEAWTFSYKSEQDWNTTGNRWRGYVRFLKENVDQVDSAKDLKCMVDCTCPDYRYRWAYNNAKAGAGALGADAWNTNNGMSPSPANNLGPGLCKHLLSLGEYLRTKIEPTAPEPPDEEPEGEVPVSTAPAITPSQPSRPSQVARAPEPPDENPSYYSDSRSGELMEGRSSIKNKIDKFVQENPEFDVPYYEEN